MEKRSNDYQNEIVRSVLFDLQQWKCSCFKLLCKFYGTLEGRSFIILDPTIHRQNSGFVFVCIFSMNFYDMIVYILNLICEYVYFGVASVAQHKTCFYVHCPIKPFVWMRSMQLFNSFSYTNNNNSSEMILNSRLCDITFFKWKCNLTLVYVQIFCKRVCIACMYVIRRLFSVFASIEKWKSA